MLIRCPSCHTEYTLQLTTASALCTCFRCDHEFYVDIQGRVSEPAPVAQPPATVEPETINPPEKKEKKITLDEKIKSIDEKYKSFEDDLSWDDDSLLTIDDLGDDDIPDVEVPSTTPSLDEHLQDISPSQTERVVNDAPITPKKSVTKTPVTTEKSMKGRLLAWRRAKNVEKNKTNAAPKNITKTKQKRSWPWQKSSKKNTHDDPAIKQPDPAIAAPKKKKHRIWPWIALILLLLMGAGLWFKKDTWIHHPLVRSALLEMGVSKTANDADWFIDHKTIQMRWQKDSEGKPALIIEGEIDNTLTIPLPLPQFEASFANHDILPVLLHSILPIHLNEVVARHGSNNPAWFDQTPVAAHDSRLFILVLRNVSTQGIQRVRVRAVAGVKKP